MTYDDIPVNFYKRDPDRALAGMAELSLQERGAYNTIIDTLYSRDGILRDDDGMLRRIMGCHGNEWRAVKRKLIDRGKIWIEDGYLKAKRVDSVLKEAEEFSEIQRNRIGKRWENERKRAGNGSETARKRPRNSGKTQQNQQTVDTSNTHTHIRKKDSPNGESKESPIPFAELVEAWNGICAPILPAVVKLTDTRKRSMAKRFVDDLKGDVEQWRALCDRVRRSAFLTGENDRGWRADFDWVLKPANFVKIIEGKYDNSARPAPKQDFWKSM